jgi:integrase
MCQKLGWPAGPNGRTPRIHDLRHTFACRRLLQWYQEGKDVEQAIAALSTYLGHRKVTDTYWYLTGVPELLAVAANHFERFACEGGPS